MLYVVCIDDTTSFDPAVYTFGPFETETEAQTWIDGAMERAKNTKFHNAAFSVQEPMSPGEFLCAKELS